MLAGLPHREPFIFVREVVSCNPGVAAECTTSFTPDDPMFAGHFPGSPLVPGVIITEALAQAAGIAAASAGRATSAPFYLLSAIRSMKFYRGVTPGECINLRAEKAGEMGALLQFNVSASVDGVEVAAGQLVLTVATRP